mgnify:CR=1 FL=1
MTGVQTCALPILEAGGADQIHVDVMDGHFVPNITIGPVVVRSLRRVTTLPIEAHLMIDHPDAFVAAFAEAGADSILVHQEGSTHLHRTVEAIRSQVDDFLVKPFELSQLSHSVHRALEHRWLLQENRRYRKELRRAARAGDHVGALCQAIHRHDREAGVRRILGVLAFAKKYGPAVVDEACAAALELEVPTYRFVRRFLERRPALQLSLKQVDPLIRELTHYRDLIDRRTEGDPR